MTTLELTNAVNTSKRTAAIIAGVVYPVKFIIVVATNFAIYDLLVTNDGAQTANNITSNIPLFRLAIVADLTYAVGFVMLIASLYFILESINRRLVLFAALWQLVYIVTWVAVTMRFFDALRIAQGPEYLQDFSEDQLGALSRLFLTGRFDRYYGTLFFYTLGSTVFNYLWYKSGYIPKSLAMFGILACVWCTFCAVAYLLDPAFGKIVNIWFFDVPMALFDMVLSGWLLVKGLKPAS